MEKLKAEAKSVRSHNIDAEEVMGMLSVVKKKKHLLYFMQDVSIEKLDC